MISLDAMDYALAEPGSGRDGVSGLLVRLPSPVRGRLAVDAALPEGGRLLVRYGADGDAPAASLDCDRFTAAGAGRFAGVLSDRVFRNARIDGDIDFHSALEVALQRTDRRPADFRTLTLQSDLPSWNSQFSTR